MKLGRFTYTIAERGESATLFFTKEGPKASVYARDEDVYEFVPTEKPSRSTLNIVIQQVSQDILVKSLLPQLGKARKRSSRRARASRNARRRL